LYFKLELSSRIIQLVLEEYNVFAYIIKGKGVFKQGNDNIVERGNLVIFDKDDNKVYTQDMEDSKVPLEILLIGKVPLKSL
jgi:hypothetical protein